MINTINIKAKSIIVGSNIPDTDYVVNPYVGCAFGCNYCYASFMGRITGKSLSDWGSYVYVKENAIELFEHELDKKIFKQSNLPTILFSSVTDPYQPIEREFKLTRCMLEIAANKNYTGQINILTKSALATRDIDIFKRLKNNSVGLTVNTISREVKHIFEPLTPGAKNRLKALEQLNLNGIKTYAFVGPIFPDCYDKPELLNETLKAISDTGTQHVYLEHINLNARIKKRLSDVLRRPVAKIDVEQRRRINDYAQNACARYGLKIIGGTPIFHNQDKI